MKKGLVLVLIVVIMSAFPIESFASENENAEIINLYSSQKELDAAIIKDITAQLEQKGIPTEDNVIVLNGIVPLNDLSDYKTEIVATRNTIASGYAGNQPTGGVMFNSNKGGTINYSPSGGPDVTCSVSFGDPYGIISVSIPLGQRTTSVTDYSLSVPGGKYYKLWVDNTYTCKKYIVYKKVTTDLGTEWVEWSGGVSKTLYRVKLSSKEA